MQRSNHAPLAKTASQSLHRRSRALLLFALLSLSVLVLAVQARAAEKIIKSHGISTFGELKYGPDFKHFDYVNPDAPKGGTFSTWGFGTFDSLTPYILKGQAAQLSSIFFESLMVGDDDEPDAMYGLVAKSIEYPENRQWAIFNMRPEAKFSDGTPVTAADVVFSFNILVEKGRPSFRVTLSDFEKVEALGPNRVKFTFKRGANTRELPMTAAGLPIFSKAYYKDRDFAKSTLEPPLGSGPYVLDKVEPGKTVSYKRRDDYWGKNLPVNVGRWNFDKLAVEYYSDYTAAFEGFKGGSYNYREEFSSKVWGTAYDFPALKDGYVIKEQIPDRNPSGTQGFWFNLRRDKFKDPRVREALGMAFNFEWSNQALFYGIYSRTDSFWENSNLQATGMPSPAELALLDPLRANLPDSVFTKPAFSPAVSKPEQLDRKTLRKAGKLMDAAGWKVVNGVRQNAKGEKFEIEILNDSPAFERIMNPYIENLKRLGIIATLRNVDNAQQTEREKNFEFDIVTRRYTMSLTPGLELRGMFTSATANIPGSANIMGLANPAIDALVVDVEKAETRADLNVAVKALDRALRSLHIWVPQWYNPYHNIAYLDVFSRPATLPPFSMGEMDFWWYDDAKAARLKAAGAL
ncbi:MAG: ABC transporter substrate-binding protein [Alphaproteobacteria bacterium]|nr:ABC transporter substrate-binding protein [Alphaproteobacteria bacterium]